MSSCRRVSVAVAGVLACAALAACDKQAGAPAAPPARGLPPLAQGAPGGEHGRAPVHPPSGLGAAPSAHGEAPPLPAGHPGVGASAHPGGALPPGHPPMPMAGAAGGKGEQTTPGNLPFDPKSVVSGELRLGPKAQGKVAAGDVVYLVARSADQPGPPLAVQRIQATGWPLSFTLDGRDAMMTGTRMAGKITVTARVDKDGDAMTKNPGDVTGTSAPITLPAERVVITLDTVL